MPRLLVHRLVCFLGAATFCLRSSATAAPADRTSEFQKVSEALQAVTQVKSDYVEEKTLRMLAHPLQSRGTLIFSPQRGIYRVMVDPVGQEMLITRSRFIQKDASGTIQRMNVRSQPAARAFVDVFLSFFSGDRRAWEKTFQATFQGTVPQWTIELRPHAQSPAAKVLQKILLEGREGLLDVMTLTETNGDVTRTRYTNHQVSRASAGDAAIPFPSDLAAAAP